MLDVASPVQRHFIRSGTKRPRNPQPDFTRAIPYCHLHFLYNCSIHHRMIAYAIK